MLSSITACHMPFGTQHLKVQQKAISSERFGRKFWPMITSKAIPALVQGFPGVR